jgi:DNA-binding transcriptional LysR family regulator
MNRMDLRHLQTFAAAAEHGSFTRAAQSLSVTQAAVSKHIAALEEQLQVTLFERSGRSMSLTEAGQRLYDYARRIFDLMDEAARELGQAAASVHGTLRIAASSVPAQSLVPMLLTEFHELYPDVHESVVFSDSAAATAAVENAAAELGIVGEMPNSPRIRARPIAEDELVLVVSPHHPLAVRKKVTLAELRQEPLIVRESGSGSQHCVERALVAAGLAPDELHVAMEMNSIDAIRAAVASGAGAAFLSRSTIQRDVDDGRLVSLPVQGVRARRQLYLITDPKRIPTPAGRAFATFVEQRAIPAG